MRAVKQPDPQLVIIIHFANRCDRKASQLRLDQQRLRLKIGDTANPQIALHLSDIMVKFRSKRRILNIVDRTVKSLSLSLIHI